MAAPVNGLANGTCGVGGLRLPRPPASGLAHLPGVQSRFPLPVATPQPVLEAPYVAPASQLPETWNWQTHPPRRQSIQMDVCLSVCLVPPFAFSAILARDALCSHSTWPRPQPHPSIEHRRPPRASLACSKLSQLESRARSRSKCCQPRVSKRQTAKSQESDESIGPPARPRLCHILKLCHGGLLLLGMSCATVIQDSQDKIRSTKRQYGRRSLIPSMNNNHKTIFETRTKTRAAYDQDRPDHTARLVWRSPGLAHASRELLYPHVAHLSLKPCSKLKPYLVRRACLQISPLVNTTLICLWNCSRYWRGTCQFNWPLSQNRICTTVAQTLTESLRGTWICGWSGSRGTALSPGCDTDRMSPKTASKTASPDQRKHRSSGKTLDDSKEKKECLQCATSRLLSLSRDGLLSSVVERAIPTVSAAKHSKPSTRPGVQRQHRSTKTPAARLCMWPSPSKPRRSSVGRALLSFLD